MAYGLKYCCKLNNAKNKSLINNWMFNIILCKTVKQMPKSNRCIAAIDKLPVLASAGRLSWPYSHIIQPTGQPADIWNSREIT